MSDNGPVETSAEQTPHNNDGISNGEASVMDNQSTNDEAVLGKRPRNSPSAGSESTSETHSQGGKAPAKKARVDDAAKAERRRILEEKKRMLAEVEKELSRLKSPSLSASTIGTPGLSALPTHSASAPTTPLLSASAPALPTARSAAASKSRGRSTAAAGGVKTEPGSASTGKRKSPGSAIPRHASQDAHTAATPKKEPGAVTPSNDSVATRAKRARRPKRLDTYGGPVTLSWALKQCQVLLKTLMTHKFGWPFNQPVDPIALNIPDYFDVIKHPMDLGTIKEQLDAGHYENEDEFAEDVRLVWANTFKYNQPGSDICIMAGTLSSIFNEKFELLKSKIAEREMGGVSPMSSGMEQEIKELRDSMTSVRRELERIKKTPNGRSRTSAAREEDARPMTFEEKKKLSHAINNLPSENLGMVVKIIHERMPQLTASGEEIEIDIDALNPITLRHLERYVRSVTQKNRRRGSRSTSLASSKNVQNEPPQPVGTQKKIEDVERQIKELEEKNKALTHGKGLGRSTGDGEMRLGEESKKKKDDDSESSDSDVGSDDSESSDSESSDSESDSGSDSDSTESESEKKDAQPAPPASASISETTASAVSSEGTAAPAVVDGGSAASVTSPSTASAAADSHENESNGHGRTAGSAISFSFDPKLVKDSALPAEVGNGDESLPQAAADDAPPKSEAPKSVALKNVDAWSELSDDADVPTMSASVDKPQSPPTTDKTWSQFQTKKMMDAIREKERLEKEERERKERERREEERKQEEERRRRELEEAEERRRREAEEAELAIQRERERQRQEERLAREKGMSMMEQSLLMASFEQQAAPSLPIFQYKQLDDEEEGDFSDLDARLAEGDSASGAPQEGNMLLEENGGDVTEEETASAAEGSEIEEGQI